MSTPHTRRSRPRESRFSDPIYTNLRKEKGTLQGDMMRFETTNHIPKEPSDDQCNTDQSSDKKDHGNGSQPDCARCRVRAAPAQVQWCNLVANPGLWVWTAS